MSAPRDPMHDFLKLMIQTLECKNCGLAHDLMPKVLAGLKESVKDLTNTEFACLLIATDYEIEKRVAVPGIRDTLELLAKTGTGHDGGLSAFMNMRTHGDVQ